MNSKIEVIYSSVASGIGEFFQLSIFHCLYRPLVPSAEASSSRGTIINRSIRCEDLSEAITPINSY